MFISNTVVLVWKPGGSRIHFGPLEGGYLLKNEIEGRVAIISGGVATPIGGASTSLLIIGPRKVAMRAWGSFSGIQAGVDASLSVAIGIMTFVKEIKKDPDELYYKHGNY